MNAIEPQVWCLLGRKAGDNTQVKALAEALGCGYQEKHIRARPWELLTHLALPPGLAGIDREQSSPLQPPWPDLVISAGRRNEPVARWIQAQSGGSTRLVHIGRPWAPLESYQLIVTTPQYFLPDSPHIRHNTLPLHNVSSASLSRAADSWRRRLGHLPRPWIAVLVGGDSGRFVFTDDKGVALGRMASALAEKAGGSLLISDSPRTPAGVSVALSQQLKVPQLSYRCAEGGDNPYLAFLALADAFVVTGESMSMLGEAAAVSRPLYIFDTGDGAAHWWQLGHNYRYKPISHHLAMALAPQRMRRDVGRMQAALVNSGAARWLDEDSELAGDFEPGQFPAADENLAQRELEETAAAVRRLLK
ncbi:MAG: mitochondrial fission ELM1 family protein [Halieaceae bacterium]